MTEAINKTIIEKPVDFQARSIPQPSHFTSLKVRVPASSANLGPGFDVLAVAFKLYCTLTFRLLEADAVDIPIISLKGKGTSGLPADKSNLVYETVEKLFQASPDLISRLRITIESDIPLGKGLGSSAAAVSGAVWSALAFARKNPDDADVLAEASRIEGHADNASASLHGGLMVSCAASMRDGLITQKLAWPDEWATIVSVPSTALSTKKSRSVLPTEIARADAVHNLQKVALLVAAVHNKDEKAMAEALHDKLHEPYRLPLVPQLAAIRKLVGDLPAIGCVLSGAGSSVLTIVHQRHKDGVLAALRDWQAENDREGEVLDLTVDQEGLKVNYE